MNQKLGQLLMIGVSGLSLTSEEKKFIIENNISGVTLFGRNVKEPDQVRELCLELQSLRHEMSDKTPLYIAIDMEGGRVARLKPPFTQWPPLKKLGDLDSPTLSFNFAMAMGAELKAVGINVDWAPCLDVFTNPENKVIGDRSLGSDCELVGKHASALIRGYLKSEITPCAKHFPGHGNTLIDSHEELPIEEVTREILEQRELVPFKRAVKARVQMIMTSHILFNNIDPKWPCTLSEIFLKKILREELRYKGLIVTDDLGMKALAKYHEVKKIPVRALQAGADLLLYCNEPQSPPTALEALTAALENKELSTELVGQIHQRILAHKKEYLVHPDPLDKANVAKIVGCSEHVKLSADISQAL